MRKTNQNEYSIMTKHGNVKNEQNFKVMENR